jgi:light-regulated signal transduction histidine kinase (bacteriophytochrome)
VNEETKRLLNIVSFNAQKMGELIENLLSFSKMGKKEVNRGEIDMDLLVKSLIEEIKATEKTDKVTWRIKDLQPCYGDAHLLKQVMINLIANAVKYSSKKEMPVVEIASSKKDNQVIYSVKDNGAGFDMKYYDKLFAVFQRLHRPAEFEGTGVGLAIVQRIIMKHHGKVWAEGEVDKGATFYFSIPL